MTKNKSPKYNVSRFLLGVCRNHPTPYTSPGGAFVIMALKNAQKPIKTGVMGVFCPGGQFVIILE